MNIRIKTFTSFILLISVLVVSQIAFVQAASAADESVDIRVYVGTSREQVRELGRFDYSWVSVCNDGSASLKEFTFENQTTNWDLESFTLGQRDQWNNATDLGTLSQTQWTGILDPSQCLTLTQFGSVTGTSGEQASHTFSIVSSTLLDGSANVDPYTDNDTSTLMLPIGDVQYEINLSPYIDTYPNVANVWDGYSPNNLSINVCASGTGNVQSFQLDSVSSGWVNTSIEVSGDPWSNPDILDPGSISSDGLWTGLLQAGKCLNLSGHGTVSGSMGQSTFWKVNVNSGVFEGGTPVSDTYPDDDTQSFEKLIGDPIYQVELSTYVGNNNEEFPLNGRFDNSWLHICASGYGSIEKMEFEFQTANWTMESITVESYVSENNNATDLGAINLDGVWTGLLEVGQCIVFRAAGPITGAIGDVVSWSVDLKSSTLVGGLPNEDPFSDNNSMSISAPIAQTGDLAIQTRLLTSGTISPGSNVSYEVAIQNVGAGTIRDSTIGLYYLLPVGASLIGLVDLDPNDAMTPAGCASMGPVEDIAPAFHAYGGVIIQCHLVGPATGIVPGSTYPFQLNLDASQEFISGATEVYGVVLSGNISEPDSATFVMELNSGRDSFRLNMNNIMHLTYDANELQVMINRCAGYSEEVTNDDACFSVEFSKPVWSASFDAEDLVLEGGGHVTSFEMISNTKWIVHISGMTPGGSLRLLLGVASVSDYSAISNGVSVLGENVIKFSVPGDSNTESSAQTNGSKGTLLGDQSDGLTGLSFANGLNSNPVAQLYDGLVSLGTASGIVSELPDVYAADVVNPDLLLGDLSVMKNNALDVTLISINLAGLIVAILAIMGRKRAKAKAKA